MTPPIDQPEQQAEDREEERDAFLSMPFLDHLEEFRKRILRSLMAMVVTVGVAMYYSKAIMQWFVAPLHGVKLTVTEVMGSFMAYFKIGLVVGLAGAIPFIFYQLWSFVSPGLYPRERRMVIPFVTSASILFLGGCAFCYYLVLPWSLQFMIGLAGDIFNPLITINSYITFAGVLILGFGGCFEMPVLAYILGKLGIISSSFLAKGRRIAIVVILIVAAVVTPTPDIFTQLLLAVPMYALYEVSIIVVRFTGRRR
jgi:sec-independent protein translocase protein TatC